MKCLHHSAQRPIMSRLYPSINVLSRIVFVADSRRPVLARSAALPPGLRLFPLQRRYHQVRIRRKVNASLPSSFGSDKLARMQVTLYEHRQIRLPRRQLIHRHWLQLLLLLQQRGKRSKLLLLPGLLPRRVEGSLHHAVVIGGSTIDPVGACVFNVYIYDLQHVNLSSLYLTMFPGSCLFPLKESIAVLHRNHRSSRYSDQLYPVSSIIPI